MIIKVVIADDHAIFRQGLAQLLESAGDVELKGSAPNGEQALKFIEETSPDVAILDLSMPGLSGIETTREIKRRGLTAKVILLTMHSDTDTANQAIKAGAMGYVLKDNAFEDLIYALRSVALGGTFISPSLASGMLKNVDAKKETELLTKREREVLGLIASGLSNRQIAEKLFISVKTVETHRARIMQALDLHKTADLVRYAIKNGLVENQPE